MKVVIAVLLVLALEAAAVLVVAFTGIVDVSATKPDAKIVRWFLETTRDSAVERRARSLTVPKEQLASREWVELGHGHYQQMCEGCHGAPGAPQSGVAQWFNPRPPEFYEPEHSIFDEPRESFWIVKHGLRMTGMPAFGPTLSDEEIWPTIAFTMILPRIPAEMYRAIQPEAHAQEGEPTGQESGRSPASAD